MKTGDLSRLIMFYIKETNRMEMNKQVEKTICYMFEQMLNCGTAIHSEITQKLMK